MQFEVFAPRAWYCAIGLLAAIRLKAHSHRARLRPSTSVDTRRRASTDVEARLRRYGTHEKGLRVHTKSVDGHRRARCEWALTQQLAWDHYRQDAGQLPADDARRLPGLDQSSSTLADISRSMSDQVPPAAAAAAAAAYLHLSSDSFHCYRQHTVLLTPVHLYLKLTNTL